MLKNLVSLTDVLRAEGKLLPRYYKNIKVYWKVILNADGSFNRLQQCQSEWFDKKKQKTKTKKFEIVPCPDIYRHGAEAKLITDYPSYVLWGDNAHGRSYRNLISYCSRMTNLPDVMAVRKFIDDWDNGEYKDTEFASTLKRAKSLETITFQIDKAPILIHELEVLQEFWEQYLDGFYSIDFKPGQCLVTGEKSDTIVSKFHFKIKGFKGGADTGCSLISADKAACHSYGLKGASVSQISFEAEEKIVQAINYLLESDDNHLFIGDITFLFWGESGRITRTFFDEPDSEEVRDYLALINSPNKKVNPDWRFNILSLAPNTARIVVKDWVEMKEPEFAKFYQRWLKVQSLASFGIEDNDTYYSVWLLSSAVYRKDEDIQSRVALSFIRNVIYGEPIAIDIIQKVCARNRIEGKVTQPRAVILALYLQSRTHRNKQSNNLDEEMEFMTEEETIAFQCGKLLGLYAKLQRVSLRLPNINNTNAVRCYQPAGTFFKTISHDLASNAVHHLNNLGKDKAGLRYYFEQSIAEVYERIRTLGDIPQSFSIDAQAYFDMGFWCETRIPPKTDNKNDESIEEESQTEQEIINYDTLGSK
jgi:CRISPR-associated protein Cas8c/Csd1 subtype I-C